MAFRGAKEAISEGLSTEGGARQLLAIERPIRSWKRGVPDFALYLPCQFRISQLLIHSKVLALRVLMGYKGTLAICLTRFSFPFEASVCLALSTLYQGLICHSASLLSLAMTGELSEQIRVEERVWKGCRDQ